MTNEEHPVQRYVLLYLLLLLRGREGRRLQRRSEPLPDLAGCKAPEFARFRNCLKAMANLDPVTYPSERAGRLSLSLPSRRFDAEWGYLDVYTVHLLFTDIGEDPSIELRAERVGQDRLPITDPVFHL